MEIAPLEKRISLSITSLIIFCFLSTSSIASASEPNEALTGFLQAEKTYVAPNPINPASRGELIVPHYQQCGHSWSSDPLGHCAVTMCQAGCAVTCSAMLLEANGVSVDPGQLNSWLDNNGGFDPNCYLYWTVVDNYPGCSMAYVLSPPPYSLSAIRSEIDAGNPVIVEVDLDPSPTFVQHFIVVSGYSGSGTSTEDFHVLDPLQSNSTFLSGYSTVSLRLYHNVNASTEEDVVVSQYLAIYATRTNPSTTYSLPDEYSGAPDEGEKNIVARFRLRNDGTENVTLDDYGAMIRLNSDDLFRLEKNQSITLSPGQETELFDVRGYIMDNFTGNQTTIFSSRVQYLSDGIWYDVGGSGSTATFTVYQRPSLADTMLIKKPEYANIYHYQYGYKWVLTGEHADEFNPNWGTEFYVFPSAMVDGQLTPLTPNHDNTIPVFAGRNLLYKYSYSPDVFIIEPEPGHSSPLYSRMFNDEDAFVSYGYLISDLGIQTIPLESSTYSWLQGVYPVGSTIYAQLDPPTSVVASDGTYEDRVYITWSSVTGASHFRVYRNTSNNSGSATALGNWQSSISYNDYSATPGQTYYYWVKAATSASGDNASDFSDFDIGYAEEAGVVLPTVDIIYPSDGDTLSNPAIQTTGTADDSDGEVIEVQVRLNSGAWETANGTVNWTKNVSLQAGVNSISAKSRDNDDNWSAEDQVNVVLSDPCIGGGAYRFNGVDQYLLVPDHSQLDIGSSEFTIEAWIKMETIQAQCIVDKASVDGGFRLELGHGSIGGSDLVLFFKDAPGVTTEYRAVNIFSETDIGVLHFVAVAVQHTPPGASIYLDGIPQVVSITSQDASQVSPNDIDMHIGVVNALVEYFHGSVDEIRISSVCRSASDIANYYASGSELALDDFTLSLWHMDGEVGSIVKRTNAEGTYSLDLIEINSPAATTGFNDCVEIIADLIADRTTIQATETIQFNDLSQGNPDVWVWDFNDDGVTDSFIQHPTYTYLVPGTYTVSMSVSNDDFADTETKINYIQVDPLAGPPQSIYDLSISFLPVDQVELNWTAPTHDIHGFPVTIIGYRVYSSTDPWFIPDVSNLLAEITENLYLDTIQSDRRFYIVTAIGDDMYPPDVLVLVTSGTFMMGSNGGDSDEQPVHQVTLTNNFYLGTHEVTNEEYLAAVQWAYDHGFVAANSNTVQAYAQELLDMDDSDCEISFSGGVFNLEPVFRGDYQGQSSNDHPVKEVSWYGAACYCDWLSAINGLEPFYSGNWDQTEEHNPYMYPAYRLPTEAEWEYAAQYDNNRTYPWGDESPTPCVHANYYQCIDWTAPVGSYLNGNSHLNLQDMSGNLWEWVGDWHGNYSSDPQVDPLGSTIGSYRVIRGGVWSSNVDALRCASRGYGSYPYSTSDGAGFRVCRTANP